MYRLLLSLLASFALLLPIQASNIVVLPQENSGNTTGYIYSPEPFNQIGTFAVDPLAFEAVFHPNGQKFYVFSKGLTKSIAVYNGTAPYAEVTSRALPNITTAKISPDGRRLVVLSQAVRIYDTANDQEITGLNTCGDTPCTPVDVDFSLDSNRAFVLNSDGSVVAINLGNNSIGSRLNIANAPTTLAVGPTGLLYVTAQNRLLELDGRDAIAQIGNEIPITGSNCLRSQFTPDGSRLVLTCNVIGSTQIYVVDIITRTVSQTTIPNALTERFKVISNSSALYYIGVSNTVYRGSLATPLANPIQLELSGTGVLTGGRFLVTTDEQPTNRYFFSSVSNTLSRINLETNSLNSTLTQPTFLGPSFFIGRAPTGIPFSLITINPSQAVVSAQRGRPLVVRALDSATRPLSGVTVNFSSSSSAFQFDSTAAVTNKDGYATVNYTAPTPTGTYTVNASTGGAQAPAFTINVTGGSGTTNPNNPGTPAGPQPIEIVSGNGQLLFAQFLAPQPLVVRLRDGSGNPQSGVTVSWQVQSGDGNVTLSTTTTDSRGLAQTQFGSVLFYNDSFNGPRVSVVRASSPNGNVDFTLTAYPSSGPPPLLLPANPPNINLISPAENSVIRVQAGTTTPAAIRASIASGTLAGFGSPMANIGFSGSTGNEPEVGPTASCRQTILSNSQGEVACDLVAGSRLGQANLQICLGSCQSPGRPFNFNLEVAPGPPGVILKRQGDNQSGGPGTLTPLALRGGVTDSFGNRLSGITVRVEIISGEATIESLFSTTNQEGDFSFLVRFGSSPGEVRVRTSAGNASTVWTLTNNVTIGNFVKVSGDNQSAVIGRPFANPLSVQLFDAQSRAIAGATVTFAIQSGQASLSATSAVTNSQGIATVNATAGANPGQISISASAVNRVVTFALTALPPGPTITSVSNAASFEAGVVPCGLATVFGSNLAPNLNGVVMGNSFVGPYPLRLNNVGIEIGGRTAPILSLANVSGREQATFQAPCDLTPGNSTIRVTVNEGSSTAPVTVLEVQPAIFETTDSAGRRIGVVVKADGTYLTRENPAVRGENLIGFFTGLGQTVTPMSTNNPGLFTNPSPVAAQIIIGINNEGAPVVSATMAPGLVGIYVVQFAVPDNATTGVDRPYGIGAIGSNGAYVGGNPSLIHIR
ncbi:MAG: Ig-like domain-containing protein [Acidobacteriota bacterium]